MTRFRSCELPATDGPVPQLAALRAIRKSAEIWLPEIVRFALAIEASTLVASRPTAELWIVPAASAGAGWRASGELALGRTGGSRPVPRRVGSNGLGLTGWSS